MSKLEDVIITEYGDIEIYSQDEMEYCNLVIEAEGGE